LACSSIADFSLGNCRKISAAKHDNKRTATARAVFIEINGFITASSTSHQVKTQHTFPAARQALLLHDLTAKLPASGST
jgi:hypothetical protein